MSWRSPGPAYLFCPGDRPDRFAKAAAAADVVILDLEDAVATEHKKQARDAVREAPLDPAATIVRVNPVTSPEHEADLAMLRASGFRTVMLAKTASASQVLSLEGFDVVALCETPEGVLAAEEIAACSNTVGLMWGAEDLVAGLGGYSSRHDDGSYRDVARYARSRTLLVARAHQRVALDAVRLDFTDLDGQRGEAQDAAAMGFTGTACIHPGQVAIIREAYRPTPAQIEWATSVLEAAQSNSGAYRVGDAMVDGPVIVHAQQIMSRAES